MKDYDWFPSIEGADEPVSYGVYNSKAEVAKIDPTDKVEEVNGKWEVSYVQKEKDKGLLSNYSENKTMLKILWV